MTAVGKKELLVHLTRLAKKGIIGRKWHKSRAGKEKMYSFADNFGHFIR